MKTQLSLFLDTVLLAQITGMSEADEDLLWAIENFNLQLMNLATSQMLHRLITEKQEELMKHKPQLFSVFCHCL